MFTNELVIREFWRRYAIEEAPVLFVEEGPA